MFESFEWGAIGCTAFGLLFFAVGLAHEFTWFRRRGGNVVKGWVLDHIEDRSCDSVTYHPVVEYTRDGTLRRFTSKYGDISPRNEKGAAVKVILSPIGEDPEVYTGGNRFLFTAVPILFGVLFLVVGITMGP